ncbi:MAG: Lrp/AsnC family transcriptional regulator [Candidatus Thorarchaeota archaeon]
MRTPRGYETKCFQTEVLRQRLALSIRNSDKIRLYVFLTETRKYFYLIRYCSSMTEMYSEKIDATDLELLRLLQINSKMKISDLAKGVGKGIATVHARMKQLQKKGVIDRYAAILDPKKVGRETLAFILVTVRYRVPGRKGVVSQREFCKEIAVHPLIQGVHVVSGDYDVLLKVRARNIDEMNRFIVDFLRELPQVDKTHTMFSMDTYLDSPELRNLSGITSIDLK